MAESSLTTLINDEIQGYCKWWNFVNGKDGFFYGIPSIYCAPFASNHILKNDTIDGTELGLKLPSKGVKRRIVACLLNGRMDG
jgi:hypothetical protein